MDGRTRPRTHEKSGLRCHSIQAILPISSEASDQGSYIRKDEHGYGSRCQPWWLYLDRRPCSLAIRAV